MVLDYPTGITNIAQLLFTQEVSARLEMTKEIAYINRLHATMEVRILSKNLRKTDSLQPEEESVKTCCV